MKCSSSTFLPLFIFFSHPPPPRRLVDRSRNTLKWQGFYQIGYIFCGFSLSARKNWNALVALAFRAKSTVLPAGATEYKKWVPPQPKWTMLTHHIKEINRKKLYQRFLSPKSCQMTLRKNYFGFLKPNQYRFGRCLFLVFVLLLLLFLDCPLLTTVAFLLL